MLTQKQLKEILHYNPETGVFIRKSTKNKAGYISKAGYVIIYVLGKQYRAHRLAWLYMHNKHPNKIDHKDHNGENNKINNLRNTDNLGNSRNLSISKANKSGVVGVGFYKRTGLWRAQININNKSKHLGYFNDKFEAICARLSANQNNGFHENHGRNCYKQLK